MALSRLQHRARVTVSVSVQAQGGHTPVFTLTVRIQITGDQEVSEDQELSLVMEGLQHGIHGTAEIRSGNREDLFAAEVLIIHRACKVRYC